jgi:hypothetical protein
MSVTRDFLIDLLVAVAGCAGARMTFHHIDWARQNGVVGPNQVPDTNATYFFAYYYQLVPAVVFGYAYWWPYGIGIYIAGFILQFPLVAIFRNASLIIAAGLVYGSLAYGLFRVFS